MRTLANSTTARGLVTASTAGRQARLLFLPAILGSVLEQPGGSEAEAG